MLYGSVKRVMTEWCLLKETGNVEQFMRRTAGASIEDLQLCMVSLSNTCTKLETQAFCVAVQIARNPSMN